MKVTIHNVEESEPTFLTACIQRVKDFYDDHVYVSVEPQIHCRRREASGWIEWTICLPYTSGETTLYLAAIQRNLGHAIEFHS